MTTQAECDAYSAVVDAIITHNESASAGDALWVMDDQPDAYVVVENGIKPDPADAPEPAPSLEEKVAALESAQSDTDSLMVDLAYRQTMLELGLDPEE